MTNLVNIAVEDISYRRDARHRSDEALCALAESIDVVGLINPIRVRRVNDEYEVVAGAHRFQACQLLGWHEMPCIIVDDDDLHAELAMLDENLCRAELSPADRAKQTARRKVIYLEIHPETAEHVAGGVAKNAAADFAAAPSFTKATAAVTGAAERTVRLDAERGEKVIDEVLGMIRGTKLDTGAYLDKIKRLPPNEQYLAAKRDLTEPRPQQPRGGVAGRYAPAPASSAPLPSLERFIALVDEIEAMPVDGLIKAAGPRRAVLNQRASGLADRMDQIIGGGK